MRFDFIFFENFAVYISYLEFNNKIYIYVLLNADTR